MTGMLDKPPSDPTASTQRVLKMPKEQLAAACREGKSKWKHSKGNVRESEQSCAFREKALVYVL